MNVPAACGSHFAERTDSEMIIWGGIVETQQGSRYCAVPAVGDLSSDGFESGDTSAWSLLVP